MVDDSVIFMGNPVDMTNENLIKQLPVKWEEITLNQYINFSKQIKNIVDEGYEEKELMSRKLAIFFYLFTGKNIIDAQLNTPEMIMVINRMNKFQADTDNNDVAIDEDKIKQFDRIDFDTFITFLKYQELNDIQYSGEMINLLLVEPILDIGNTMNMAQANSFFLRLRERLNQYLTVSQTSLKEKMKQLKVQELLPQIKDS